MTEVKFYGHGLPGIKKKRLPGKLIVLEGTDGVGRSTQMALLREWLETDMAQAFMQAYRAARAYVIEASADEIAAKEADFFPGIDTEVLTQTIAAYQSLGCWTPHPEITRDAYDNLLEVFLYNKLITQRHDYELCVTAPPDNPPDNR